MNKIYKLIFRYKIWKAKRLGENISDKQFLELVLFAYKFVYKCINTPHFGLCWYCNYVSYELGIVNRDLTIMKGFKYPKFAKGYNKDLYWWPTGDRKSRINFLKDLIKKQ